MLIAAVTIVLVAVTIRWVIYLDPVQTLELLFVLIASHSMSFTSDYNFFPRNCFKYKYFTIRITLLNWYQTESMSINQSFRRSSAIEDLTDLHFSSPETPIWIQVVKNPNWWSQNKNWRRLANLLFNVKQTVEVIIKNQLIINQQQESGNSLQITTHNY